MPNQSDREAILREIAKKKVVYHPAALDAVRVRRDLTYQSTCGANLLMDVYYPPDVRGPVPVVVIPLGYPDPDAGVRRYGPFTSWAGLIAASGMAAVLYGSTAPADDVHALLRHVRERADSLELAIDRIGIFAGSGNVAVALSALMRDRQLTCAALLCGYTMDLDGSSSVADASREAGFVDACAGRSPDDLPDDVPMLFVRAGRDRFAGLNEALDTVVVRALARNLPIALINHATGDHGFDLDEDSDTSRGIVRQILTFLCVHLGAALPS